MGSYRAAVCTPSRIMLMTGRNLWETEGYNVNYPPLNYIHDVEKNLFEQVASLVKVPRLIELQPVVLQESLGAAPTRAFI